MKKLLTPIPTHLELNHLLKDVPESIWDLIAPYSDDDIDTYVKDSRALRIREQERNYVLEIQRHYELPIRPNEPLKRTMIRVRLQVLKKRRKRSKKRSGSLGDYYNLPVDPLE